MIRPAPEYRVLRALDDLRDAMAALLAEREPDAPDTALLTLTDAALRLGIARSTVTRWADTRRIATVGPRHARRVPLAELARMAGRGDDDQAGES